MRRPEERKILFGPRALGCFYDGPALPAEGDYAECAVAVIVVAGGEEELIGIAVRARRAALTELNGPDVVDLDGFAGCVAQRAEERAAFRIKGVDASTGSVVGDQERIAHRPKIGRRQRDAPGRMKSSMQRKLRNRLAGRSERGYKTALRFVESRVGDPNRLHALRIGNGLNAVRSEFLRDFGIDESIRTKLFVHQFEIGVEYVDPAVRSVIRGV